VKGTPPFGRIPTHIRIPFQLYTDEKGDEWWEAICPFCGVDLSTISLGRAVRVPQGDTIEMWAPMKCPECKHRLLPNPRPVRVVTTQGLG